MASSPPPHARGLPVVRFATREAWQARLEQNHAASPGVWLQIAKRAETRTRRLRHFIEMLERGEKLPP